MLLADILSLDRVRCTHSVELKIASVCRVLRLSSCAALGGGRVRHLEAGSLCATTHVFLSEEQACAKSK